MLAHHDKVQLQDKGHNSESLYFWSYALFLTKNFNRMMAPDRQVLVLHVVLLFSASDHINFVPDDSAVVPLTLRFHLYVE